MALTLSEVKFWEAMGEEITIHMAFFLTLKDCPAKFSRSSDQRKYYFFDLSCNQLPQLWPEMQIRPFKSPTGI